MRDSVSTGSENDRILWLGDMQAERHENLYVDSLHYTAAFTKDIAGEIRNALIARGLLSYR